MALNPQTVDAIRRGDRGMAVVVYLDMTSEEIESSWSGFPEVIALGGEAGQGLLDRLKSALTGGQAVELRDRAAESLSLLMASSPEIQSLIASMLEGVAGRRTTQAPA